VGNEIGLSRGVGVRHGRQRVKGEGGKWNGVKREGRPQRQAAF
jgi:hypothetical protein